jgi:hypothetical protein
MARRSGSAPILHHIIINRNTLFGGESQLPRQIPISTLPLILILHWCPCYLNNLTHPEFETGCDLSSTQAEIEQVTKKSSSRRFGVLIIKILSLDRSRSRQTG